MREPAIGLLTSSFPWEEVLKAFLPPALELGDAAAPDAGRQHRRGEGSIATLPLGRAPGPSTLSGTSLPGRAAIAIRVAIGL